MSRLKLYLLLVFGVFLPAGLGQGWIVPGAPFGRVWVERALPDGIKFYGQFASGNGIFLAADINSKRYAITRDGIDWECGEFPEPIGGMLTFAGDRFFVLTKSGDMLLSSSDGRNWIAGRLPAVDSWLPVVRGDGLYVAIGKQRTLATSENGSEWTGGHLPESRMWGNSAWGKGSFVIISGGPFGDGKIVTSVDCLKWETVATLEQGAWTVAFGCDRFVAVFSDSQNGQLATSPDGRRWTVTKMPQFVHGQARNSGDLLFVRSGWSDRVFVSRDGITWERYQLPAMGNWHVEYGNGIFIAIDASKSRLFVAN